MRTIIRALVFVILLGISTASIAAEQITGVFSNKAGEFKTLTLMVHQNGVACLFTAIGRIMGQWAFDERESILTFTGFDPGSDKETTIKFSFDKKQRAYSIVRPQTKARIEPAATLQFVTSEFPKQVVNSFMEYPEEAKQMRAQKLAEEEEKRKWKEQLEREKPEYERILGLIKANPKHVLAKEFFVKGDTPATRAFMASLLDKKICYPDEVLAALLEQLPDENHWIPELVFSRPELTSETIKKFYPRALKWGELNYCVLANLAKNPNTPISLIEDLAGRQGLAIGATIPARERLQKLQK